MIEYALHYADIGVPVLPLYEANLGGGCTCSGGIKCTAKGKHPRTRFGVNDASLDRKQIEEWWERWPTANIGLRTGKESGIFVIDIDPKSGGQFSLERLVEKYEESSDIADVSLNCTLKAYTGGGGCHYFFKWPNHITIKGSQSVLGPGIDVRGEGNYVVAAPSIHSSGSMYRWHGVKTPIREPPDWLLYEIVRIRTPDLDKTRVANNWHFSSGNAIEIGNRNTYLFRQACGLANTYPPKDVLRRISDKNRRQCKPPLDQAEVVKLVRSAVRTAQRGKTKAFS